MTDQKHQGGLSVPVNGTQAQLIAIGIKNNTMKHINDLHVDLPIDV